MFHFDVFSKTNNLNSSNIDYQISSNIEICNNLEILNDDHTYVIQNKKSAAITPLVVLYSTMNRFFEKTVDNHMSFLNRITDNNLDTCIVGMHTWDYNDRNEPNVTNDDKIIEKYINNYKYTTSINPFLGIESYQERFFKLLNFSTREALENAESVYYSIYKKPMPDNQPIIKLRYDMLFIDIEKYIKPLINDDGTPLDEYFFISYKQVRSAPEICNEFFYTNKKTIELVLKHNYTLYPELQQNDYRFIEPVVYKNLRDLNINVYSINVPVSCANLCRG